MSTRQEPGTRPVAPSPASGQISVHNPATGERIAAVENTSSEAVAAAARRARQEQPAWAALGFEERGRVLRDFAQWMLDNAGRLGDCVVAETGKPRDEVILSEIAHPVAALHFWADKAAEWLADEEIESVSPFVAGRTLTIRHVPVGVVGVISPWNFPLTNAFDDCIPALAAGNAVINKPSEVTPLTPLLLAEGLRACGLPEDVFQVVTGDGATGGALIDEADFIMFTGSTATGKKVMERAARTLTPVSLELGGKDPMIVLADADIERAANGAAFYSMVNSGQVCISVERVYVEEPVYAEFVERVEAKVRELRQGPAGQAGQVDVGPMIHPPQMDVVASHVEDAVSKGARVITGGTGHDDGGRWFEPTILVDVDHSMTVMQEETFGPVLPIVKVRDAEEALALANDCQFGLLASVWTGDAEAGERLARRIEAGAVCVNDAMISYNALELPFGGWKQSGIGRRHGIDGIRKYTQEQAIVGSPPDPASRDLHMFPHTQEESAAIEDLARELYGQAP